MSLWTRVVLFKIFTLALGKEKMRLVSWIRAAGVGIAALMVSALLTTPAVAEESSPSGAGSLRSDVNGDGRDDVVSFTRGGSGDVYVSLSNGTFFSGTGVFWNRDFSFHDELPLLGDFNGDARHDAISLQRGSSGDVLVALSNGGLFLAPRVWHTDFSFHDSLPSVGDFNGDGRDDIAAFTRGSTGDVNVAVYNGSTFITSGRWHGDFSFNNEIPGVGDVNGDGRDDIVTFHRGGSGDVYVALSTGNSFSGTGLRWHDNFSFLDELPQPTSVIGPIVW